MHSEIIDLAKRAGSIIRDRFRSGVTRVATKGRSDYVSYVDRLVEDELVTRIHKQHPDHAVLAEEGSAQRDPARFTGPTWIIDPLDGTTNFLRGIPGCAVSIAFCETELRPRTAVVYDPIHDELFSAEHGAGAWLNKERIYTSGCRQLDTALIASALPFRTRDALEDVAAVRLAVQRESDDNRRIGSAALEMAYVACGRLDGYWEIGIYPWDTVAGELLVRCAGGAATDFRGDPGSILTRRSIVCAATSELHAALSAHTAPLASWLDRPQYS